MNFKTRPNAVLDIENPYIMDICSHGIDVSLSGSYRNSNLMRYQEKTCPECNKEKKAGIMPEITSYKVRCKTPTKCWRSAPCTKCSKTRYVE